MTPIKAWRPPTSDDIGIGMAALAEIIGDAESVRPIWTRRLVRAEPGGEWCLTIDQGGKPTFEKAAPWADPIQVQGFPTAYPLPEAVAILRSPGNPEAVLVQRREACRVHEAEELAAKAKKQAEEKARQTDAERLADDERKFNAAGWHKLDPWQQAFFAVAVRVERRDPDLAADLRAIGHEGRGGRPAVPHFPRCKWDAP